MPINLLGHRAIAGAQAGLDVRHADAEFVRRQRAGERGVDVADNEHEVRFLVEQHFLEPGHDLGGLSYRRAGTDAEVAAGLGDGELFEEDRGHLAVVVLTGQDQLRVEGDVAGHRGHEGRDLDEVRACAGGADDAQGFHSFPFPSSLVSAGFLSAAFFASPAAPFEPTARLRK